MLQFIPQYCTACFASAEEIAKSANANFENADRFETHYAVRPGGLLPVLLVENGKRVVRLARWGLTPRFIQDPGLDMRRVNAQAESLGGKSMWKAELIHRCVVIANGFYVATKASKKGPKQNFYVFQKQERNVMLFAGLWDMWHPKKEKGAAAAAEEEVLSVSIITAEAGSELVSLQRRVPVVLADEQQLATWLTCCQEEKGKTVAKKWWHSTIKPLLVPPKRSFLEVRAISSAVDEGKDGPECIAVLPTPEEEKSSKRKAETEAEAEPQAKVAKEM